jgi:hypothetical protein
MKCDERVLRQLLGDIPSTDKCDREPGGAGVLRLVELVERGQESIRGNPALFRHGHTYYTHHRPETVTRRLHLPDAAD